MTRSVRRRVALGVALVGSWRPTGARLVGLVRSILTSFVALGVAFYVLPGRQSNGPLAVLVLVIVVAVVGTLLRPVLLGLAVLLGPAGLLIVGVLAQGAILAVAVELAPDIHVHRFTTILGAAWIAATVAAVVNWLLDSGSQDAFLAQVLGRVVRIAHTQALAGDESVGQPGLVVVQLDGVGRALLRQAIVAGNVPTLARWLRCGTHRVYGWHTGVPATTPAGQAVLLHGNTHVVPSFRWYDKAAGRMVVANRPADAHLIEQRLSDGRGLLADGGVSVSNLFSGDAATRVLTMSDARLPPRSTRGLAAFATASLGFVRTLVVFAGQVVEEVYQARRQKRRDVRPRVPRGRVFALLRGVTTALLHDLNVAIVAEQMARGAPVIYVDFVDYDEIAHHAGPSRPEAMRTLDGLDRVLRFLEDVAAETNRRYELVVVSDHGQVQGEPFAQLTGQTLDEVVARLCGDGVHGDAERPAEQWSNANVLLTGAARSSAHALRGFARRRAAEDAAHQPTVSLGDLVEREPGTVGMPVVASSGSVAHLYLPAVAGRASASAIERHHPGLIAGLAAHDGIGAVMVRSDSGSPIVHGPAGTCDLTTGELDGDDPLAEFGPDARPALLELDGKCDVGDLVVLGRVDTLTGEVAAFESLVGSHGGLGGDQTEAVLFVPSTWPPLATELGPVEPAGRRRLTGPQVHAALVARLETLGLRTGSRLPPGAVMSGREK